MIPDEYYDSDTYNLLYTTLTAEDKEYINKPIRNFIFSRWRTIVNSFPAHYNQQYALKTTQLERNAWFKKYLDYPTKDISLMPEVL
jgi:hypothetical protein